MKRITNYALNCLINQGISKKHIKSLIKAIENQTKDNILTPEQAIEILLDGVIHEEELHQQTVLDLNACCSGSTLNFSIAKNALVAKTLAKKVEKALQSKKEADKACKFMSKLDKYIINTAYRYIKESSNKRDYYLYIRLSEQTGIDVYNVRSIIQNTCGFSYSLIKAMDVNIDGNYINYMFTLRECETIFTKIISKVPSKFWDECIVIYTLDDYCSVEYAAEEWFRE